MEVWRQHLMHGQVIPACPLALWEDGRWSERHQRALIRYYLAAGAGGVAVGVHSTQFAIRDPQYALYEPVLRVAAETVRQEVEDTCPFVLIAGICGPTSQAVKEAEFARDVGYQAGLVSLTALNDADDDQLLAHCRQVSAAIPIVGFYLQPAVGGRVLRYPFWRGLLELDNTVAIKIAPFNRYFTNEVVRATVDSGREDVALYTGNDDNIILDLLTPFTFDGTTRYLVGGLLGQWGIWTRRAVELMEAIREARRHGRLSLEWLRMNAELTDANGAVFDAANQFAGCIAGINEVLRRVGLLPSNRCLDLGETLSPGQAAELDRVTSAYPQLIDDCFVRQNVKNWLRA